MIKFKSNNFIIAFIVLLTINAIFGLSIRYFLDNSYNFKILSKLTLFFISFLIAYKLKFLKVKKNIFSNTIYLSLSLLLILISYNYINESYIKPENINPIKNIQLILNCISVSLFEETLTRVYLYNSIKKNIVVKNKNKKLFYSILLTSFLFAIAHTTNIFNPDIVKITVINQIFFAFSVGILLQSIYIRTKSLVFTATFHALINYYGSYHSLKTNDLLINIESYSYSNLFISLLLIIIISFLFIFPLSYIIIKKEFKPNS